MIVCAEPDELDELDEVVAPEVVVPVLPLPPADALELVELEPPQAAIANAAMATSSGAASSRTYLLNRSLLQEVRFFPDLTKYVIRHCSIQRGRRTPNAGPTRQARLAGPSGDGQDGLAVDRAVQQRRDRVGAAVPRRGQGDLTVETAVRDELGEAAQPAAALASVGELGEQVEAVEPGPGGRG